MKYGVSWNYDIMRSKRHTLPNMTRLPFKCCANCNNWIQFTTKDSIYAIGTCTEKCIDDYDMFSWADDVCDKIDNRINDKVLLDWKLIAPDIDMSIFIIGKQYLLLDKNDNMVLGEFYIETGSKNKEKLFIIDEYYYEFSEFTHYAHVYKPEIK